MMKTNQSLNLYFWMGDTGKHCAFVPRTRSQQFHQGHVARCYYHDPLTIFWYRVYPAIPSNEATLPLIIDIWKTSFADVVDSQIRRRWHVVTVAFPVSIHTQYTIHVGGDCVETIVYVAQNTALPFVNDFWHGTESCRLVLYGVYPQYRGGVTRHAIDTAIGTVAPANCG
jgi:hypothetical protein